MQQLLSEQTQSATRTASVGIDLPGLAHGYGSEGEGSRPADRRVLHLTV